jgi:hypothetical protein
MNFLKHIFSYDFLIYINRVQLERVDKVFALGSAVIVALALVIRIVISMQRGHIRVQLLQRFWRLFLTMGLLGLVWFGARYELVSGFGSHLAFLLLVVIGLIWLGYIVRYWLTTYKRECVAWEHKQQKDRYLKMR